MLVKAGHWFIFYIGMNVLEGVLEDICKVLNTSDMSSSLH